MRKTYYEKVGRRYIPVRDYDTDFYDSIPRDSHVLISRIGNSTQRQSVEPALAPMIAAGIIAKEEIINAISKASALRPHDTPITPEQKRLWEELSKSFGASGCMLEYDSAYAIAQAGVDAMVEAASKLLTTESTKSAYEHFMLISQLTK